MFANRGKWFPADAFLKNAFILANPIEQKSGKLDVGRLSAELSYPWLKHGPECRHDGALIGDTLEGNRENGLNHFLYTHPGKPKIVQRFYKWLV